MSRRPPSTPPELPGFHFVRAIGAGGFADVFLYEQELLRRRVAVKVLLADRLGEATIASFNAEANLMAPLGTHPAIVSVYEAGISRDGRPYLVMEYCSKPNLQVRHRRERFSEAEALRIGVQIAGAVETAHRAGILHRDIKPANILVTEYGRPALTDFGISATVDSAEQTGMSVPWSPPEILAGTSHGDARSDVYSLAATVYTLLSGRSPFELPGASNAQMDQAVRIQSMPVPPLGRADVSASFEQVLRKAMAKSPADRHASALEFGRALQRVQAELGMQPTVLDVVDDEAALIQEDEDDGLTRVSGIVSIEAQGQAQAPAPTPAPRMPDDPPAGPSPFDAPTDATVLRDHALDGDIMQEGATVRRQPHFPISDVPPVADTALRPHPVAVEIAPDTAPRRGRRRPILVMVVALAMVAAGGAVAFAVTGGGRAEGPRPDVTKPDAPVDAVGIDAVPAVEAITGTVTGAEVAFTWTNPDPQPGDTYLWRAVVPGAVSAFANAESTSVTVPVVSGGSTCIEVLLRRENGRTADEPVEGCTP